MAKAASAYTVLFLEEPVHAAEGEARLAITHPAQGIVRLVPELPAGAATAPRIRALLEAFLVEQGYGLAPDLLWFYTPMALDLTEGLAPTVTVYDCMDELSLFQHAAPGLAEREQRLLARADLVFTGGRSLYEAKAGRHPSVHCFPSSVDVAHFAAARSPIQEPEDQAALPGPRAGYAGVIDERLDIPLLAALAAARPALQIVMVGPVVKIDPASLPRAANIHYLGQKPYAVLPAYMAGWDAALLPFARNDATRFISPTKTPEYLAAGRAVVSTPITDVRRDWGDHVAIAADGAGFAAAIDAALAETPAQRERRLAGVDQALAALSWDRSWAEMHALIAQAETRRHAAAPASPSVRRGPGWRFDVAVVGAGFAGSVAAERLAALGKRVLVVDRRAHPAGNAFDETNEDGILVHRYGPHIFHTNAAPVFDYLSRFTAWRPYEHRVLASVRDRLVPVPINRTTVNTLFDLDLAPEQVARFLAGRAETLASVKTSEDVVVSRVGRELYELMFRGYTRKQWGVDASQLDKSVTARIPVRHDDDDRYFGDTYQAMPRDGYTRMFERMLDHPNIELLLGTDWADVKESVQAQDIVFTGPVDEYFGHRYGPLPYRSLTFKHVTVEAEQFQPVGVVNYPDEAVPYTRITEYKHLTGQLHRHTSLSYEFATDTGDPYYPVPRPENAALYQRYQALADATPNVHFVGRLATYRYYNMDQVVAQALALVERMAANWVVAARRNAQSAGGAEPRLAQGVHAAP